MQVINDGRHIATKPIIGENMKIVFLISCIKDGGAEHVMSRLVNHWAEAGHEVAVGCFEPFCRENSQWILDSRIRLLKLWELPKGRIAYRLSVRRMLRELNPDVIISFLCGANIFAVTYGKLLGRYRVILSERGNPAQDTLTRGMQWKRKLLFRLADRFVCQTRQAEEFCIPYYHLDRGRCTVIPNPPPIPPQRPETAPRLLPKKAIVAAGRLMWHKGFDNLIDAFAVAGAKHPEWTLHIFGEGEDRQMLQQKIDNSPTAGRIFLPGNTRKLAQLLPEAEIFALSSRSEGMPNILLEAMAAGCACAAFDCQFGPQDIIQPEQDGLLVPANDMAAFAHALDRLMSDEALRHKLGEAAARKIRALSVDDVFARWDALLQEVTGITAPPVPRRP